MPEPVFATAKETAARFHLSPAVIYAAAQRGEIPVALRLGKSIRFDLAEVEKVLRANASNAPSSTS